MRAAFGFTSDETCLWPGTRSDADPLAPPGHDRCDL